MEQVYTSKIDAWLAVVLLAAAIAFLVAFLDRFVRFSDDRW